MYIRSFPDGRGPWQASERGGEDPFWSGDGSEPLYSGATHLTAIAVDTGGGLTLGARRAVVDQHDLEKVRALPAGRGLVAIRESEPDPHGNEIRVVLGWLPAR